MSSVRRLSKGSNVSAMDFESDEELVDAPLNRGVGKGLHDIGRHSSSHGGAKNATEQTRIAEMYKTVIKLAAENVRLHFFKLYYYFFHLRFSIGL